MTQESSLPFPILNNSLKKRWKNAKIAETPLLCAFDNAVILGISKFELAREHLINIAEDRLHPMILITTFERLRSKIFIKLA